MTIKQQGGIFGRNPSFNDVEINELDAASGSVADFNFSGASVTTASGVADFGGVASTVSSVASGTPRLQPASDGTINLGNAGSRRWKNGYFSGNIVLDSGSGIDFSATSGTGTSELFDDYEEGDHEVSVTAGTSGTITVGASSSILSYTKVGRQVTVMGRILIGSVSSPVGALKVSLPFVIGNMAEFGGYVFNTNHFYGNGTGVSDGASYYTYAFSGTEGQATISLFAISRAGIFDTTAADWLGANSEIYVNFTYFTS